jgi:hypothetical protein
MSNTEPQRPPAEDAQDSLRQYLQVIGHTVDRHHAALWEEEKHYTWWLSILFAAAFATYLAPDLSPTGQAIPVLCISLVGCVMSLAAYRVISLECQYFQAARQSYVRLIHSLGISSVHIRGLEAPWSIEQNLALDSFENAIQVENRGGRNLLMAALPWCQRKPGIIEVFKLTFAGAFVAFAGIAVVAVVVLCRGAQLS